MLACAVLLPLLAAGWWWVRDSSVVAVETVAVAGTTQANAGQIERALRDSASTMTTLHVEHDRLVEAVRAYPNVAAVHTSRDLPHNLSITVVERDPVARISVDGKQQLVSANGTVLAGLPAEGHKLPTVTLARSPGGTRITGRRTRGTLATLGATPGPLLDKLAKASWTKARGLEITTTGGITFIFGDATDADAKWASIARILDDRELAVVRSIDARDPKRPALTGDLTLEAQRAGQAAEAATPGVAPEASPTAPPEVPVTPAPGAQTP